MKNKFTLYPKWVFDSNVTLWSYRNNSLNLTGDKGKKAVDLVGSMFEEFYRDTDSEVFTLISEHPSSDSYVKIVGNENAMLRFHPKPFWTYLEVYTMKRENIPKVRSLLDDRKLLFLADVKFDEFLKEINGDEKKVIDLLKKYPQHIPEDAEKKISIEFPKAYKIYKYVELSGDVE